MWLDTVFNKCTWLKLAKILPVFILVIAIYAFFTSTRFGAAIEALTPPDLPESPEITKQIWLEQNWDQSTRKQYHYISQGTRTIPVPYDWFIHLPLPSDGLLGILFATSDKLVDNDYITRFGFIQGNKHEFNPDGLPIGIVKTPVQNILGITEKTDATGLTCAACHTGQLVHNKTQYVIDGGAATTDIGQFTKALIASLGQLALSAELPLFNGRFDRFARNVLGNQYSDITKAELAANVKNLIEASLSQGDIIAVQEGYMRIDALNRIGNEVFSKDLNRRENYAPINAPVNYPHIWTSSWLNWVQYDGSIMQPLSRNTGEALGVSAYLDTRSPPGEHRFSSSIPLQNLHWIEQRLAGKNFSPDTPYTGLTAPTWPDEFGQIDSNLAKTGKALYDHHCKACHLPPLNSDEIWQENYYGPVVWKDQRGHSRSTEEKLLKVRIIPQHNIGTDPAQGRVLVERRVNTAGISRANSSETLPGMGINTHLCAPNEQGELVTIPVTDGPDTMFALALVATVQETMDSWFKSNYASEKLTAEYTGDRPNCLQGGKGYKARPLDGIWATPPYLHNGSVPSIMDLLKPVEERPKMVQLGDNRFDPANLGIYQDKSVALKHGENYATNGFFILDTSLAGNANTGHEFSSAYVKPTESEPNPAQPKGVIGPLLSPPERQAIIEYLKTL